MQTAPVYCVISTLLPCGRFSVNMAQSYKKNIKQPKEGTENVLADRFSVPSRVFPRCFSVYKVMDVMRSSAYGFIALACWRLGAMAENPEGVT